MYSRFIDKFTCYRDLLLLYIDFHRGESKERLYLVMRGMTIPFISERSVKTKVL